MKISASRNDTDAILGFSGDYRWLSNFYPVDIEFESEHYPSVEHAYQAAKTLDLKQRKQFQDPTVLAAEAKKAGSKVELRVDWTEENRLSVMKVCLKSKFSHPSLAKKLLDTGEAYIEETNYWGDKFWGVGNRDGQGSNWLGHLIMNIRDGLDK